MKCDKPFHIDEELMNFPKSGQFTSNVGIGNFTENASSETTSKTSADCTRMDTSGEELKQIKITNLIGAIESSRMEYAYESKFIIQPQHNADSQQKFELVTHSTVWERLDASRRHS
jgi:hypothetical protein